MQHVYVYAVTRARPRAPLRVDGVLGAGVREITFEDVAALASDVDGEHIRATRRDLVRHSDVVAAAFERKPVLPLRFGTVLVDDDGVVSDLLKPRQDELTALLDDLDGKVELTVKAFYREDAVLTEIVAENPRIARLREATSSRPAAATYGLRLELGQAVARELDARRSADSNTIVRTLLPLADDLVVDERQVENLVLKASLLVDRRNVKRVDAAMEDLAQTHAGRIQFKYVGPLPPHSFVEIDAAPAHA